MKKTGIVMNLLSALVILALLCPGAAAEGALPEIPAFQGALNVRPIASEEEAIAYAKEIWALDYLRMDFPIEYYEAERPEQDCWVVYAKDGPDEGDYCYGDVMFDLEGNVIVVENASSGAIEVINEAAGGETNESEAAVSPEDDDARAEWREMLDRKLMYPFLAEVCPRVYEEYTALRPIREGTSDEFLTHYDSTYVDSYDNTRVFDLNYSEAYQDDTWRIRIIVQTSPVIRIVCFDAYTDAEEGGNG